MSSSREILWVARLSWVENTLSVSMSVGSVPGWQQPGFVRAD